MVTVQIVERYGSRLFQTLKSAMRTGELRTFSIERRGKKVKHANPSFAGWMTWTYAQGVISAVVQSPRKPGGEWQLLSAFIGRLAHKYGHSIVSISIQFPEGETAPDRRGSARRRKASR